jgi:hypothetical protein
MTDDEIAGLDIFVLEVDRPVRLSLPRYATNIMTPCLTKVEALQRALQNSARTPCLHLRRSTCGLLPPPPSLATLAYASPAANWSWAIPDFVILDDDEEYARVVGGTCAF